MITTKISFLITVYILATFTVTQCLLHYVMNEVITEQTFKSPIQLQINKQTYLKF